MKTVELKSLKVKKPTKKVSKKALVLIILLYLALDTLLITKIIIPAYANYPAISEEERIEEILKTATIVVDLKEDLNVSFYEDVKVSDFITNINGTIVDDYKINTKSLGKRKVKFEYINEENIKIPYAYTINVVDDVPPSLWMNSSYSVTVGYTGNIFDKINCADNLDDNPKCEVIGNYDYNKVGNYKLTYKATDKSGNITAKEFTLKVKEPSTSSGSSSTTKPSSNKKTDIKEVIKRHKNENTSIGIDVSSWQGNIDFQKVKEAGVEFAFIRVGSKKSATEYFVDSQFINNVKGFNEVGIPVGIYYYSYASSRAEAIKDAKWVLNQIKGYKIDLPIVYDWENWSIFDDYHQSFYSTSMNAKAFLDTMKKAGYDGLLYSSANYLNKVWFDIDYPVWLAHYTWETNYSGKYTYWQLCSNGKVPGISGNVDINIYYKNKEE